MRSKFGHRWPGRFLLNMRFLTGGLAGADAGAGGRRCGSAATDGCWMLEVEVLVWNVGELSRRFVWPGVFRYVDIEGRICKSGPATAGKWKLSRFGTIPQGHLSSALSACTMAETGDWSYLIPTRYQVCKIAGVHLGMLWREPG